MSLAQFADASFGYPGNDILVGASLLIRPGDWLALLDRTAPASRRRCASWPATSRPTAATCACSAARSVAYLRQSQELGGGGTLLEALLEPFADLQKLHDEMAALEATPRRR